MNPSGSHILCEADLATKKIGNHLMFLDKKDSGISKVLLKSYPWKKWPREPEFMDIIQEEVCDGMVALDIGANIGYVTLILAELVGRAGHVYAVEPGPRNFEILRKNIDLNNYRERISAYQIAISDRNEILKLYMSQSSNLHSITASTNTEQAVDVVAKTGDEFLEDKMLPSFIKMDLEGAEVEAIRGMIETLSNTASPVKILIEVHPMYYSAVRSFEYELQELINIGFGVKYVITAGTSKPDLFAERNYEPTRIYSSGTWSRGVYTKVSTHDAIVAACYPHEQLIKRPWTDFLKRPWRLFDRAICTHKIVRGLLLEK